MACTPNACDRKFTHFSCFNTNTAIDITLYWAVESVVCNRSYTGICVLNDVTANSTHYPDVQHMDLTSYIPCTVHVCIHVQYTYVSMYSTCMYRCTVHVCIHVSYPILRDGQTALSQEQLGKSFGESRHP